MHWSGVLPAMTTPFDSSLAVDHTLLAQHAAWLLANGCTGLVMLGSLGEGATLEHSEKIAILKTAVKAAENAPGNTPANSAPNLSDSSEPGSSSPPEYRSAAGSGASSGQVSSPTKKPPVVAAISSLSTPHAVQLAQQAEAAGCDALMVLPPYVYTSDWREMKRHVATVLGATKLPCMLYNNPVAYKTDFLPAQIAELAGEHPNLEAVKESSADLRRVAAIRAVLGDRLQILVGVDDAIVEGVGAGAVGWVAGLVNAFPAESVALFDLARCGRRDEAFALYRWFLPLLRMDTVPKFVQLIKWVQSETGTGSARVRAPRLTLEGAELTEAQSILDTALAHRPAVRSSPMAAMQEA